MTWSKFDDGYDEHEKIEDLATEYAAACLLSRAVHTTRGRRHDRVIFRRDHVEHPGVPRAPSATGIHRRYSRGDVRTRLEPKHGNLQQSFIKPRREEIGLNLAHVKQDVLGAAQIFEQDIGRGVGLGADQHPKQ